MSRDHFIERCVHGTVISQCRCIGPKTERTVDCRPPCSHTPQLAPRPKPLEGLELLKAQARGGSESSAWAVAEIERLTVDRNDYRRRRDEGTAVIRRLQAALEKISVEGAEPGEIEIGDDPWPFDGWHTEDGYRDGKQAGRFEAGEIARAVLGGVGVRGWPSHVCKFMELAEIFRGLWFSSVRGEIRWTVTFRRRSDGEIVETDYFDTPVKALDAAIGDCAAWGKDDA